MAISCHDEPTGGGLAYCRFPPVTTMGQGLGTWDGHSEFINGWIPHRPPFKPNRQNPAQYPLSE